MNHSDSYCLYHSPRESFLQVAHSEVFTLDLQSSFSCFSRIDNQSVYLECDSDMPTFFQAKFGHPFLIAELNDTQLKQRRTFIDCCQLLLLESWLFQLPTYSISYLYNEY